MNCVCVFFVIVEWYLCDIVEYIFIWILRVISLFVILIIVKCYFCNIIFLLIYLYIYLFNGIEIFINNEIKKGF